MQKFMLEEAEIEEVDPLYT